MREGTGVNLFCVPPPQGDGELVETLLTGACRIERIVSRGHASPPGFWYDQSEDEWVCVLTGWGELEFPNGTVRRLTPGETCFLPAHLRHRVRATSSEPACIWLCMFRPME